MNDTDKNADTTGPADDEPTELDVLKIRATAMGIQFHPAIGVDKLRAKVNDMLVDKPPKDAVEPVAATAKKAEPKVESKLERDSRLRKQATRLMRVRVTCMDPAKKEWDSEIFTFSNSVIGTIKKLVPFNTDDGWHVPVVIYNMMKEKKCQIFYTVKGTRGEKVRKGRLVPAYNIEILPDLTQAQLDELAKKQAMANNLD